MAATYKLVAGLVLALFTDTGLLARAARGVLDDEEQVMLAFADGFSDSNAVDYATSLITDQVGASVLFFTLLLPGARDLYEPPPEQGDVVSLLSHPEARVRAMAAAVRDLAKAGEM